MSRFNKYIEAVNFNKIVRKSVKDSLSSSKERNKSHTPTLQKNIDNLQNKIEGFRKKVANAPRYKDIDGSDRHYINEKLDTMEKGIDKLVNISIPTDDSRELVMRKIRNGIIAISQNLESLIDQYEYEDEGK